MNSRVLLLAVTVLTQLAIAAPAAPATKAPSAVAELKSLQGTWTLVEAETQNQTAKPAVPTQWIFAGQKLYLRTGKKTVLQGIVSLNPAGKPKVIDVVGKGKPAVLGIYELSGGKLKIAAAPNERPAGFSSDGPAVVSVLERAKAPHSRHRGRALL